MRFLGTTTDLLPSKIIRGVTGDDCSHFAIHFTKLGVVLHSDFFGVRAMRYDLFIEHKGFRILHEVPFEATEDQEISAFIEMTKKSAGCPYGYAGVAYAGGYIYLHRKFGYTLPVENDWVSRDAYFCTQLYDVTPDWLIPVFPHLENLAMVSPHALIMALIAALPPGVPHAA